MTTTTKIDKIYALCSGIIRDCAFISLHTNRQNQHYINNIMHNILSIYEEFRELAHKCNELSTENQKLTEDNNLLSCENTFLNERNLEHAKIR